MTEANDWGLPVPRYMQVKQHVLGKIASGEWKSGAKLPSENDLVRTLGVSRMTVNRALRELTSDGTVVRIQGVGSFVAKPQSYSEVVNVFNIYSEIRNRGKIHTWEVKALREKKATAALAARFDMPVGSSVFFVSILHMENGEPIQLEERHVNPFFAPDMLEQDFNRTMFIDYLTARAPPEEIEYLINAVNPDARMRQLLAMLPEEACLVMFRRVWVGGRVASDGKLWHPGSRYQLGGRFRPGAGRQ